MEENLREILAVALEAAEPGRAVHRVLSMEGSTLRVDDESFEPRGVFVLAVGKAAGAMARVARTRSWPWPSSGRAWETGQRWPWTPAARPRTPVAS